MSAQGAAQPLPVTLDGITPEWLTAALRTRTPDVSVRDVEIADIIRGTCTKIRLRLDVDEAGRDAGIPGTLFLKGGFEQAITNLAHRQPALYGLATVVVACFTGWLAGVALRRD